MNLLRGLPMRRPSFGPRNDVGFSNLSVTMVLQWPWQWQWPAGHERFENYTVIVKSDAENTCTVGVCYNQVTTSESHGGEAIIQEAGNFR